jgi:hypothetical protein
MRFIEECGTNIGIHQLVVYFSAGVNQWFVVPNLSIIQQDMQSAEVLFAYPDCTLREDYPVRNK